VQTNKEEAAFPGFHLTGSSNPASAMFGIGQHCFKNRKRQQVGEWIACKNIEYLTIR
jgi:hypothetical protein